MSTPAATFTTDFGSRWINTMFAALLGRVDELGDLDRQSGDGDFGTNIAAALRRAKEDIAAAPPADYAGWVLAASRGFLGTGGTSGPLFGMFLRAVALACNGMEPTVDDFSKGLNDGLATVQRYGNAEVGEKTMIDALAPAAEAFEAQITAGANATQALATTADASVEGAKSTAAILARRGRASYVGDASHGVLDPGAVAMAIMIQTAAAAQSNVDARAPLPG